MTIDVGQYLPVVMGGAVAVYGAWQAWKQLPAIKLLSLRAPKSYNADAEAEMDRHTVLAIAGRWSGNPKAVSLCEQLLHEMLRGPGAQPGEPVRQPL